MIPPWTEDGVLPPINAEDPTSPLRSPYISSLQSFVSRFATTAARCVILDGYLRHRAELHLMGIVSGFQWVDGSFTEHIELIDNRPPSDIDVVTFCTLEATQVDEFTSEQWRLLLENAWIKEHYNIDFYAQDLNDKPENLVSMTAYWYSMWSHRRTMQWKGFLQIDLSPSDDSKAMELLAARTLEHAHEQE